MGIPKKGKYAVNRLSAAVALCDDMSPGDDSVAGLKAPEYRRDRLKSSADNAGREN